MIAYHIQRELHVTLSGTDPDISKQDTGEADRVMSISGLNGHGPRAVLGGQRHGPHPSLYIRVVHRERPHGLSPGNRHRDVLTWFRAVPPNNGRLRGAL